MDGQYVHIEELVKQLEKLGHEITMIGPVGKESEGFGSESKSLGMLKRLLPGFAYELLEFGYSFLVFFKLLFAIRRFRPDVIYERFNLFTPSGIWAKRLCGIPLILEVNAPLAEERAKHGGLALPGLARWTQRVTWTGADAVIVVTEVLRSMVEAYGVQQKRLHVMPNGVDTDDFDVADAERQALRTDLGVDENFVIGFTGFVREWHGLDRLVGLLAEDDFSNAVLLIVGDGPARATLERQAADLGVADRFQITGVIARRDVPRYVSTFDVAMQANVVPYASPLKVLEYLCMGKAIIAPDMPNIRELLEDDKNALLFDSEDVGKLAQLLRRVMSDAELRHRLEAAANQSIASQGLTWRRNAERVGELASVLAGH